MSANILIKESRYHHIYYIIGYPVKNNPFTLPITVHSYKTHTRKNNGLDLVLPFF